MERFLLILTAVFLTNACSTSYPCTDGGDISWNPPIVGDRRCGQRTLSDGRTVNQGRFIQFYGTSGDLALDGSFEDGKKSGIWSYFAPDHHLIAVKFFDRGVEKTPPLEAQKNIDLIIQQKAGKR